MYSAETRIVSVDVYRQQGQDKLVFTRQSYRLDIIPHMLHVVTTLEGVVDSLDVMPKDSLYSIRSSFYPRRILDVYSKLNIGFFVLI